MKKILQVSAFAIILVAGFFIYQFLIPQLRPPQAFLKVTSSPTSKILLSGEVIGESPLQKKDLKVGSYDILLKANVQTFSEQAKEKTFRAVELKQKIDLNPSAVTSVNYEFAPSQKFSSGEILDLRSGAGISVVTEPDKAEISLNGESLGASTISQVIDPGVHKLKISKEGYITREIGINIESGFRLTVWVALALDPYPKTDKLSEKGKFTLFCLPTNNTNLNEDYRAWVEAIWYFQNSEKNVPKKYDLLIDENGKSYTLIVDYSKKKEIAVGYLSSSAGKLSTEAKKEWDKITKGGSTKKASTQIEVLDTPNGFLNVRSGPSTNNNVLIKIKPGETFSLTKEQGDWFEIIYEASKTGWIFSKYAKKL